MRQFFANRFCNELRFTFSKFYIVSEPNADGTQARIHGWFSTTDF